MSDKFVFFSLGILLSVIIDKWIQANSVVQQDTQDIDANSADISTTSEKKRHANAVVDLSWFDQFESVTHASQFYSQTETHPNEQIFSTTYLPDQQAESQAAQQAESQAVQQAESQAVQQPEEQQDNQVEPIQHLLTQITDNTN